MRQDNRSDPANQKKLARQKYVERQIDKWVRWSMATSGRIKFKELVEIQDKYNIKCYG
jgi:hypothetical protein